MSRVVIDTNILYSLVGLSENPKVSKSNIKSFKLSITTPSLVEAIVKYHHDLESIKLCIEPILKGEFELISIGHAPIPNQYLVILFLAKSIDDANDVINSIKTLKISKEAEFYRFILMIVISGLFTVIREDGYKFDDEIQDHKQLLLVKSLLESHADFLLDFFKEKIREGYEKGNQQQAALDAFEIQINKLLMMFRFNYHMVKTNFLPGENYEGTKATFLESFNNDNFDKKFKKYIENPISYVSKIKYHPAINHYLNIMKDSMLDLNGFTEKSLQFLLNKIEHAYKDKSKIRKNDIFDSFIVISLKMRDTRIVTLDQKFLRDLKSIHPDSYQLCQELGYMS